MTTPTDPHASGPTTPVDPESRQADSGKLLPDLTFAIAHAGSLSEALAVVLRRICEATGWAVGEAWLLHEDGTRLRRSEGTHTDASLADAGDLERFSAESRSLTFVPGEGVPGRIWAARTVLHIVDLVRDASFCRQERATAIGLTGLVGIPVLAGESVAAVLVFLQRANAPALESDIRLVEAVAAQLGTLVVRRRAEEAHRLAEARLGGIISIAADAIISIDAAQRITMFNVGAESIFGYQADEMLGRGLEILLPENVRARHGAHIRAFAESPVGARRMGERALISGRRKSGEIFPAEASISKLQVNGEMVFTVILRDVTEQRRTEDGLRFLSEAGKELGRTLDMEETIARVARLSVPTLADCCAIDLVDEDGALVASSVVAMDPSHERALREARDRHRARWGSVGAIRHVRERSEPLLVTSIGDPSQLWPGVEGETDELAREVGVRSMLVVPLARGERGAGAVSLLMTSSSRHFDDASVVLAGELAARLALALDNGTLYRVARQAVAARDEVVSIVSHDLRNPLSVITMCSSALAEDPHSGADTVADLARSIGQSAEWMSTIIQDLLDVARLESGRLQLRAEPQALAPLIERSVEMHEPLADERAVSMALDLAPALPMLPIDAGRLMQVLANLLGNAIKFTPSGGTVTVRARPGDGCVIVSVADTGRGIAAEHLPHLFDRFWQAHRADRERGTGLGLAIAKGIVEAHGGTIGVASAPGKGSEFTFTLPAATSTD